MAATVERARDEVAVNHSQLALRVDGVDLATTALTEQLTALNDSIASHAYAHLVKLTLN